MSRTKELLDEMDRVDPHEEDRLIDEARQTYVDDVRPRIVSSDVPHPEDCYYRPSLEEKKLAIINDLKKMAPHDWDELTVRELVHLMASTDVVLRVDTTPWVKGYGGAV